MTSKFVYVLTILCLRCKVHTSLKQNLEGRIIDGDYVKINNYPHAVFLEISTRDSSTHVCGSSIVNQHFLLTAAHCFTFQSRGREDKIVAFAGHENLKQTNVVRKAQPPIIHENFDLNHVVNDIALIYLPQNLPLGERIKRILIKGSFPRARVGAIAGWGIINEITSEETMLLKTVSQIVKNKRICSSVVNGPGTLCAGSTRSSHPRPAQGDSGSGLITNGYQLIGLLSFKQSSHPALPVYTNVSYYYDWIEHQIIKAYCKF